MIYRKKMLYLVALFLILEGVAIVVLPSRVPRPWRVVTGAINGAAAIALVILALQRKEE